MNDFKQLEVWKQSIHLAKEVYVITSSFPKEEMYGITSQLRRAAVSISSNIAEGCGRRTAKDFISFLHTSMGSCKECENLFLLSRELGYVSEIEKILDCTDKIGRMLTQLIKSVRTTNEEQQTNNEYAPVV